MKLSIIIPALNEEKNIEKVIDKIPNNIGLTTEIIVIDDGSTDNTAKIAKKCGAKVISHKVNKGYGAALLTGFKESIENRSDFAIVVDGDLQHDTSEIVNLLKPLKSNEADFVIGSRFLKTNNLPLIKRFSIPLLNFIMRLITKQNLTDTQSGFRGFRTEILKSLKLKNNDMGLSLEILFQIIDKKYRVKEVPITCIYKEDSHKLHPLKHLKQLIKALINHYRK